MASGKRKFRIELEDAEGSKYNLSLEGNVSKDKIMRIVEFMDLLNNIEEEGGNNGNGRHPTSHYNDNDGSNTAAPASVGDKIWNLVHGNFPYGSFTSSDILELYEDRYNEPIKLSIISTYLSRYAGRGRLARTRQGKEWAYKTTTGAASPSQPARAQAPSPSPALTDPDQ